MAGDWIKMRSDLAEDPAVIAVAAALDTDEFAIVGRLHHLWSWFDSQSRDGHAAGVTRGWIDRKTQMPGFAAALESVGWLVVDGTGASVPKFDRHNGKTAKARALSTNRKQSSRANGHGSVSGDVPSPSRQQRDKSVTREEKRREEEKKPPRTASPSRSLSAWARSLPEGEKPIPPGDPVFGYAEKVGLPEEFLALAWRWMLRQYGKGGPRDSKRYADWRKVFRNAVEGNWGKLWYVDGEGRYALTTVGLQLQRALEAAA